MVLQTDSGNYMLNAWQFAAGGGELKLCQQSLQSKNAKEHKLGIFNLLALKPLSGWGGR